MIIAKKRACALICVGGVAFTAGCAPEPQADQEPASVASAQEPLYIEDTDIWPRAQAIPICWETSGFATEKGWVRDAIEGSWGTETGASFSGWATCDESFTTGLRILIADEHPGTTELGTDLDDDTHGLTLNFTFANFATAACAGPNRERCIRTGAIHEFGHLLAFSHEQNRDDTPEWCDKDVGEDGTVTYGAWDLESVMDYCSTAWTVSLESFKLSPTDIAGASFYYGGSHPISAAILDSADNKCAAWRGIDRAIYVAQSAPTSTSDTVTSVGGLLTSDPTIVASNGRFDVFARGDDGFIYHMWQQGTTGYHDWTALGTGLSYSNPTAVNVDGHIHVFIRGMDDALWHGVVDGDSFGGWSSLGGTVTGTPSATLASYAGSTAMLHVAVRDHTGALAHRAFNVATSTWSAWSGPALGSFWGSPSLVASGASTLEAFVRGKDEGIYRALFNGTWGSFQAVASGQFYSSPTAVSWGPGRVDVFARGKDNALWHTFSNSGAAYAGWASIGGLTTSSPTAVAWGGNALGVFSDGLRTSTTGASQGASRYTWGGTTWQWSPMLLSGGQHPRF
jgi:hypothetical protein